jgi:signal transduction histidine kinase
MSQDHLGLFDTPPDRREVRFSVVIVALLFSVFIVILPLSGTRWGEVVAFIPVVDSIIFVGELIIATLLYAQAAIFRSRSLTILASGYLFLALLLIPHALTFPGAFSQDGLLNAGLSSTAWLSTVRRIAFPLAVIFYVGSGRPSRPTLPGTELPQPNIATGIAAAVALAAGATILTVSGHDLLPPLFTSRGDAVYSNVAIINALTIALTLVAMGLLFLRRKSVLDLWLLVALAAWLIQSLLNLPLRARFTVGWYSLYTMMLISHLIVLIALIAEVNRLYSRLALATAARNREREAQRMSMDAVAAAISHEVGQPLAAVSLNASAGLNWLTSPRPNVTKAIEALHAISDSGRRSFDVLKSIRAMFAKKPGWASELILNDVVHETVTSLDAELAGARVSLQLSLDEELPPIMANRVQLQHVVSNLIANAIESLSSTRGRRRRITIQSSHKDHSVLLEISDNGIGIAEDDTWRVFDAFQATSANGDGIRLSICRTIVEEHGGRIWASRGDDYGATFHVQLPGSRSTVQY